MSQAEQLGNCLLDLLMGSEDFCPVGQPVRGPLDDLLGGVVAKADIPGYVRDG